VIPSFVFCNAAAALGDSVMFTSKPSGSGSAAAACRARAAITQQAMARVVHFMSEAPRVCIRSGAGRAAAQPSIGGGSALSRGQRLNGGIRPE